MKRTAFFYFLLIIAIFATLPMQAGGNGEKSQQASEGITWLTLEEAQEKSKDDPRMIFIDVYTDWCGWCKKMDQATFSHPDVVAYVNKNYYAVKLDAESDNVLNIHGEQLTEKQIASKLRVTGYPTIVVMDEEMKRFYPRPGFKNPKGFIEMLEQVEQEDDAAG